MPTEPIRVSAKTFAWHSLSPEQTMQQLDTGENGISEPEAALRRQKFGENRLKPPKPKSAVMRFLAQFNNVLIYILLAASLITFLLGHWIDSGVILAVIVINAIIGVIQEGKAEKALASIRNILALNAVTLRDGQRKQIPAEQLVPGDIVLLQSGDKVPADLRLLTVRNLRIDEAALTGESEAVEKYNRLTAPDAVIAERFCMAYSGTLIVYGQGTGVVVATGESTEIGCISRMLAQIEKLNTPLLRKIADFGRRLAIATLLLAIVVFTYGLFFQGYGIGEIFLATVGMAVAAIPEELPPIMTIALALGVQSMARHQAIVRHLPAVETLGSVTTICTDKTGTLTRNEMTVQSIVSADHQVQVSGAGYAPSGNFNLDDQEISIGDYPDMLNLIRAGMLCNDARLNRQASGWSVDGDPTEGALIVLAMKSSLDPVSESRLLPRADVIPFESEHRFMATLHRNRDDLGLIYVKGAPEDILTMCDRQCNHGKDSSIERDFWLARIQEISATGQRVLAIASRTVRTPQQSLQFSDVKSGLTMLGLVGIMDPPREEAIAAVERCHAAGIRVKMITGDHRITAASIGQKLNIGDGKTVVTGAELDAMDDAQLRQAVVGTDVFARATPEHKLRLVKALQDNGEIVAMTGDGVNDAPALKRADVGIAMGQKGTEVAKEAAEIVLVDDNFASIAHAVEEGRTIYDNIKKTMVYVLPTNCGEVGIILLAIFLGIAMPITAVQILWINMVTTVTLAITLSFERPESGVMSRPPHNPSAPILSGFLVWRIVFVALLMLGGGFALYFWEITQGSSVELGRTVVVNVLVMCEIVYLFNCRYLTASSCSRQGMLGNRYALLAVGLLLILQLLFTYWPTMQRLFGTTALDAAAWGRIAAVSLILFLLVELEKYVLQHSIAKKCSG